MVVLPDNLARRSTRILRVLLDLVRGPRRRCKRKNCPKISGDFSGPGSAGAVCYFGSTDDPQGTEKRPRWRVTAQKQTNWGSSTQRLSRPLQLSDWSHASELRATRRRRAVRSIQRRTRRHRRSLRQKLATNCVARASVNFGRPHTRAWRVGRLNLLRRQWRVCAIAQFQCFAH